MATPNSKILFRHQLQRFYAHMETLCSFSSKGRSHDNAALVHLSIQRFASLHNNE
ncbi:hypothetical protein CCACVL1_08448 [Corchorus capsularis]|uniref:Uncharacterized protein n=1 Tax=Corchorus capsularis TaxID=210143 RepID=A0A1R3J0I8_COCAP|nr:hypothetical protein CCACVL1_08448 [Corchorus capsularis]